MSTRGAHSWVRMTPTGLPDCTSIVSSALSVRQRAHQRVERLPVARGPAGAAVDDEVVGVLGDLGVEVVLQHAQRGLLRPAERVRARCRAGRARGGRPCGHVVRRLLRRVLVVARAVSPSGRPIGAGSDRRRATVPLDDELVGGVDLGRRASGRARPARRPLRTAACDGRRCRRRASSGARRSSARAAVSTSIASTRESPSTRGAACAPALQPIETWSSCIAEDGIESTLAGAASRLISRHDPGLRCTARSCSPSRRRGRRRGTAAGRGCASRRACGRCAAREIEARSAATIARKSST